MTDWRSFARDWFPPAALRLSRRFQHTASDRIWFEGDFPTWDAAAARCTGYHSAHIMSAALEATLKVTSGAAVFERDSVVFDRIEYSWPALAGLLSVAARHGGRLNVLDFGGAFGSSYFQNRKFLSGLRDVRWNIVEQPHYIDAGRTHVEDDVLKFYGTIDECFSHTEPDVVLLSSVLQYLPDPYGTLADLLARQTDTVILDRTPYLQSGDRDRIFIQHVPASIYAATYPCRFFVERAVHDVMATHGYRLVEAFPALDALDATARWRGHVFTREPRTTEGTPA